jgi:enoyl-[acyl-carrier protein] reductase I
MGNARPEDLAFEVAHLLRPNSRITAEVRHVDGGYHVVG